MNKNLLWKFGGSLVAIGGLAGLLHLASIKNNPLEPLGWADINHNGTHDAIITRPVDSTSPKSGMKLGFVDGDDITTDSEGNKTYKIGDFHHFYLEDNALHRRSPLILLPQARPGVERVVRMTDKRWNRPDLVDLELYTTVDVEPGHGLTRYQAVSWKE